MCLRTGHLQCNCYGCYHEFCMQGFATITLFLYFFFTAESINHLGKNCKLLFASFCQHSCSQLLILLFFAADEVENCSQT